MQGHNIWKRYCAVYYAGQSCKVCSRGENITANVGLLENRNTTSFAEVRIEVGVSNDKVIDPLQFGYLPRIQLSISEE